MYLIQLEVKTYYKNIQYCVRCITLGAKRKQALLMGRPGILLMLRITNLSNANVRFSASISGDGYVDFKDGMLIEQLTVLLTYFQITFFKDTTEENKIVPMPSVRSHSGHC